MNFKIIFWRQIKSQNTVKLFKTKLFAHLFKINFLLLIINLKGLELNFLTSLDFSKFSVLFYDTL